MADIETDVNLSRALSGLHLIDARWARIDIGADHGFSLDSASETFVVHFVLAGEIQLSCAHGEPIRIATGESLILPNGAAHVVRTAAGARLERLTRIGRDDCEGFSLFDSHDSPSHLRVGMSEHQVPTATVLSGQMTLTWPQDLLPPRDLLPRVIEGMPGYRGNPHSASQAVTSLREMVDVPGGSICLARFAHLLVTRRLREQLLEEPALVSDNPRASVAIARVIQAVRREPGQNWSVNTLARQAGMSRSGFAEKFRLETGRTPMEVVTEVRMEMAARLLRRSREPIKSISASTGYSSSTAFIRTFRRQYGRSPTEFRHEEVVA